RRPIQETNKLRILNLPRNVTSEELKDNLIQFGEVDCNVVKDKRAGIDLNIGFATFTIPAQAANARNALNGRNIFGEDRAIRIIFARTQEDEKAKLHIQQLPPSITSQKLRLLFEKYGVKNLWILNSRNINRPSQYQSKFQQGKFAFIVLNDESQIENAINEMNNVDIDGWKMSVEKQMPKEEIELKRREKKAQQARQQADYKRQQANQQRQYIQTKGVDVQIYEAGNYA
ncbi:MAG: hypothetical protein EZS28_054512, partial [Streblomastix strix]